MNNERGEKVASLFTSRRFYVAIAAAVVAFSSSLGTELDPQTVELLVMTAAAWMLGDSFRKTSTNGDTSAKKLAQQVTLLSMHVTQLQSELTNLQSTLKTQATQGEHEKRIE